MNISEILGSGSMYTLYLLTIDGMEAGDMNPFCYFLNLYRIGLIVQSHWIGRCADMFIPGTMCLTGNPPLFTPGQTFEAMNDESERSISEALTAGL